MESDSQSPVDDRVAELVAGLRDIDRDQLRALADAIHAPTSGRWDRRDRFWYDGTAGLRLTPDDKRLLDRMWVDIQVDLAETLCGEDVRAWARRPGLMAKLDRIIDLSEDRVVLRRVAHVLERCVGTWIWASVIAIWNAFCAELFADQLSGQVRGDLEEAWLEVVGARPMFIR